MTPLHTFGQFVRQALLSVPMWAAKLLFVGSLAVLLIWVLSLPKSQTQPEGGARRWDENLKITACAALLLQIVIYSLFG